MVLASGDVIELTLLHVGTNELGVSCETRGLFTPTEIECPQAWASKQYNPGNSDAAATYEGVTAYSFMPNGCVINHQRDEWSEADWIDHGGRMYYNRLGQDYTQTQGIDVSFAKPFQQQKFCHSNALIWILTMLL